MVYCAATGSKYQVYVKLRLMPISNIEYRIEPIGHLFRLAERPFTYISRMSVDNAK
jgi:hypothetical protein